MKSFNKLQIGDTVYFLINTPTELRYEENKITDIEEHQGYNVLCTKFVDIAILTDSDNHITFIPDTEKHHPHYAFSCKKDVKDFIMVYLKKGAIKLKNVSL